LFNSIWMKLFSLEMIFIPFVGLFKILYLVQIPSTISRWLRSLNWKSLYISIFGIYIILSFNNHPESSLNFRPSVENVSWKCLLKRRVSSLKPSFERETQIGSDEYWLNLMTIKIKYLKKGRGFKPISRPLNSYFKYSIQVIYWVLLILLLF